MEDSRGTYLVGCLEDSRDSTRHLLRLMRKKPSGHVDVIIPGNQDWNEKAWESGFGVLSQKWILGSVTLD